MSGPTLQQVWYVKTILFNDKEVRIITHDANGPSSFIAVCNILILRGDIDILPPYRKTVGYLYLSHLVAEYLLENSGGVDISAALTVMPYTLRGMDLNPMFYSSTSFHPASAHEGGGVLKLFSHAGILLVHSCMVDPSSPEAQVIKLVHDYDTAASLVLEADQLVGSYHEVEENPFADPRDESESNADDVIGCSRFTSSSRSRVLGGESERQRIEDAKIVRRFLEQTQSQMTYYGLFQLARSLPPNIPTALFRNSHLTVLYKTASQPSPPNFNNGIHQKAGPSSSTTSSQDSTDVEYALYTLVTNQIFLNEPSVVWERLEDIDGDATYVDHNFMRSSPAGGDVVGQTAEQVIRAADDSAGINEYGAKYDLEDAALARQIQATEDRGAQKEHEALNYLKIQERIRIMEEEEEEKRQEAQRQLVMKQLKQKKSECVIM